MVIKYRKVDIVFIIAQTVHYNKSLSTYCITILVFVMIVLSDYS